MDFIGGLKSIQAEFEGSVEFDAPLSKFAYYRIGGPASVLVTPRSLRDLSLLKPFIESGVPVFILGWGSNLLFSDEGFPGIVIRMKHLFTGVEVVRPGVLRLGASLGASSLLRHAAEKGYGGLARFTGIPGSIGGMIAMNAGTHLGEMSGVIEKTEWINLFSPGGLQLKERNHTHGDFSYRRNHFLSPGDLITHAEIRYEASSPDAVKAEIDALYLRRKATQPVEYPSCGSVFMNPTDSGLRAWEVVEKLGLRGKRIGNAQISEKHPNFIVNLGGAKASEVRELIALVKAEARARLGIELQTEVRILP